MYGFLNLQLTKRLVVYDDSSIDFE